jgi:transcriptional regulator with XRE-family HTH domain
MRNNLAPNNSNGNLGTHDARRAPRNHRVPLRAVPVDSGKTSESDREVVRCEQGGCGCGLVQFRTKNNVCRRCLRLLPCTLVFRTLPPAPLVKEAQLPVSQNSLIKNIGRRIAQIRESRGMTQSVLQARSRVSRSYLSRIESGQMTPSLGTLEKIGEAVGIGLDKFFVAESSGENLIRDTFVQSLRPFLNQLKHEQWKFIMVRLRAISGHVESEQIKKEARPV